MFSAHVTLLRHLLTFALKNNAFQCTAPSHNNLSPQHIKLGNVCSAEFKCISLQSSLLQTDFFDWSPLDHFSRTPRLSNYARTYFSITCVSPHIRPKTLFAFSLTQSDQVLLGGFPSASVSDGPSSQLFRLVPFIITLP